MAASDDTSPLWIIDDLHGDLLALEAALTQVRHDAACGDAAPPRIIFLAGLGTRDATGDTVDCAFRPS